MSRLSVVFWSGALAAIGERALADVEQRLPPERPTLSELIGARG